MALSKEQEEQYRKTLEQTKERIRNIEAEMESELEKTRKKLRELLEEKKAMRKIYDGIVVLLGVENEFEKQEEESGEPQGLDLNVGGSAENES